MRRSPSVALWIPILLAVCDFRQLTSQKWAMTKVKLVWPISMTGHCPKIILSLNFYKWNIRLKKGICRDGHANEVVFLPILVVHWVQILILFGCQIRFELSGTVSKIGYFLTIVLVFCLLSNSSLAPLCQPLVWSSCFLMALWKHCKGNFIWIYYTLWTKLFAQITRNKSDGRKESSKQKTLLSKSNLW